MEQQAEIAKILDDMEQTILIAAGSVKVIRATYGDPYGQYDADEQYFGLLLKGVIELKGLLNIPTSLKVLE